MASDVAVAVPYGSLAQGQGVYGTATGATTAYSPWDTTTVTAAAGAGAGTSPPAPVVGGTPASTMIRGSVTWGTGTSTATGSQVSITFGSTFPSTPIVVLTPTTIAAGTLNSYVLSVGTTGFTIAAAVAPTASQGATVFGCSWWASL
jgi:hypothetical protein